MTTTRPVTELLRRMSKGDSGARDQLVPLVYEELRQLAARYLRDQRKGHTLQTTALAHEAYLRMVDQLDARFQDRVHFLAVAAISIRRILIGHARKVNAERRGGARNAVPLNSIDQPPAMERPESLLEIDEALKKLGKVDPRKNRVVELRYFGGLLIRSTAAPGSNRTSENRMRLDEHGRLGRCRGVFCVRITPSDKPTMVGRM